MTDYTPKAGDRVWVIVEDISYEFSRYGHQSRRIHSYTRGTVEGEAMPGQFRIRQDNDAVRWFHNNRTDFYPLNELELLAESLSG